MPSVLLKVYARGAVTDSNSLLYVQKCCLYILLSSIFLLSNAHFSQFAMTSVKGKSSILELGSRNVVPGTGVIDEPVKKNMLLAWDSVSVHGDFSCLSISYTRPCRCTYCTIF